MVHALAKLHIQVNAHKQNYAALIAVEYNIFKTKTQPVLDIRGFSCIMEVIGCIPQREGSAAGKCDNVNSGTGSAGCVGILLKRIGSGQ